MRTVEVASAFGVGISFVKSYAKTARAGGSLHAKRSPGRRPKADERARRLLEADLPGATGRHPLRKARVPAQRGRAEGERAHRLSALEAHGVEQKKRSLGAAERDEFLRAAWRALVAGQIDARAGVRGRDGLEHVAGAPVRLVATREAGACRGAWQLGANVTLPASMSAEGMRPCLAVEGSTTREVFEACLEHSLTPALRPGQVVVMDNLSAHKGGREIIETRGCEMVYLPPYSPDLNPIEEAFAELKTLLRRAAAPTREALVKAMGQARWTQ